MARITNGFILEDDAYAQYVNFSPTTAPSVLDVSGYSTVVFQLSWTFSVNTTLSSITLQGSNDPSFATAGDVQIFASGQSNPFVGASGTIILSPVKAAFPRYLKLGIANGGGGGIGTVDVTVSASR